MIPAETGKKENEKIIKHIEEKIKNTLMSIQTGNKIEKNNHRFLGALKILEVINKAIEHVCDSHIYSARLEKYSGVQ